jgi:hypothetical protein
MTLSRQRAADISAALALIAALLQAFALPLHSTAWRLIEAEQQLATDLGVLCRSRDRPGTEGTPGGERIPKDSFWCHLCNASCGCEPVIFGRRHEIARDAGGQTVLIGMQPEVPQDAFRLAARSRAPPPAAFVTV